MGEPGQSLANPAYGPMPSGVSRTTNATRAENQADTLAVYVNDTLEINKQWKLVGGLRRDKYSADIKSINNSTAAATVTSRTDKMTSVRAGAIYQPNRRQSYYVSYGTSFNPSAETLTIAAANANVDPERSRSFEVGAKWNVLNDDLALTTALFRIEKTNARSLDTLTGSTSLNGRTRVEGFELAASGQIARNWQVFAGYTYLDGKIVELTEAAGVRDGNVLPNTPEHSASLWTVYGFAKAWEIGGGIVYSSERLLNNANTAKVEGYTRLDATLAYKLKDYDLRLNLLNLNDEEYFETASAARATPAKGRSAVFSLNYRF